MKHMVKKAKIAAKKWNFRGKKGVSGSKKIWAGNQTRKAKWCKMQPFFLKTNMLEGVKGQK